jgi:hypothetical protein
VGLHSLAEFCPPSLFVLYRCTVYDPDFIAHQMDAGERELYNFDIEKGCIVSRSYLPLISFRYTAAMARQRFQSSNPE